VSGITGAAPVWQEVMQYLHAGAAASQPAPPPGVLAQAIRYQGGVEAARTEYFLAGTAQSLIVTAQPDRIRPAIRYPTPGLLVALDPDIPPARQRMRLAAQGVDRAYWRLDGKPLPGADSRADYDWQPWPGRHTLALLDAHGAVLDEVRFEVRGAVARVANK
jgi:penicillin-binding protein 1C